MSQHHDRTEGSGSTAAPDDVQAEFVVWLPVLNAMISQLQEISALVEKSLIGICERFQNMAALVQNNVALTTGILGGDTAVRDGNSLESLFSTIRATIERVDLSEQASARGAHKIAAVQEGMKEIRQRTLEVNDIFTRLNILGLNAFIEAAGAGEHGRTFAVVAQETRALSKNAAQASRAIQQSVNALTSRVEEASAEFGLAAEVSREVRTQVDAVLDLLDGSHDDLRRAVTASVHNSRVLAGDIGSAVTSLQFQDRVSQQMGHIVRTLEDMTDRLKLYAAAADGRNQSPMGSAEDWARQLILRCTMQSERDVVVGALTGAAEESGHSGKNIELF